MYSNQTVGFVLQKLDVAQEKVRVPTLEVLKHVINSCGRLDMLACGCIPLCLWVAVFKVNFLADLLGQSVCPVSVCFSLFSVCVSVTANHYKRCVFRSNFFIYM